MRIEFDTKAFAHPEIELPDVWTIRQKVDAPKIDDIEGETRRAFEQLLSDSRLRTGASIAIGVGSRGIANLVPVVRTVIAELQNRGMKPFIVPAMGSHGGATAEGQIEVLESYGITKENVGAEIRATMEVDQVGALEDGYPVYFDRNAHGADAVIVINRIKPHTDFQGEIESGPAKMCAIGLGKQKGASRIHRFGAEGLRDVMPKVARKLIQTCNILGGIALIENLYGETAEIHGLTAEEVGGDKEKSLLNKARKLCPKLPFDHMDVLVIDEMGKDISGCGMDTHVIGRARMPSMDESTWEGPNIRIVCVLDITEKSHGNAAGFGLADFTTKQLLDKVNLTATLINHETSGEGGILRSKLPIVMDDAESCVKAAIAGCGRGLPETVRFARIRNTALVGTLEISGSLMDEVRRRNDLEIVRDAHKPDLSRPLA